MRVVIAVAAVCFSTVAHADARLDRLVAGYESEDSTCIKHADGVAKVATGATALAEAAPDDKALAADRDRLNDAVPKLRAYCDELAAALDLARTAKSYKDVEHDLDDHDNKIRKLRQTSRKLVDEVAPAITRLIPRINARAGAAAPPPEKKTPGKFPSGHKVDLPVLPGEWRISGTQAVDIVDYAEESGTATVSVRAFSNATCEQQRSALKDEQVVDVETSAPWRGSLAWYVTYRHEDRTVRVACQASKTGGYIASVDEPPGMDKVPLEGVMVKLLDAQTPR